jgi:hypothetical protein
LPERKIRNLKKGRRDYKYKKGIEEKERGSFTLSEEKVPRVGAAVLCSYPSILRGKEREPLRYSGLKVRKWEDGRQDCEEDKNRNMP